MTRVVVTGGAGFIGSHLVEHLLAQGCQVAVIDNFSTGRRENLQPFWSQVVLHELDLQNLPAVRQAVEGVEYVFHQAALPSVPRSLANPLETHQANATSTLNLLIAAKDAGVKRVIYAGSSSAYGDTNALVKTEDLLPQPISPYGVTKLTGEHYCRAFYECYGLETVTLRYFNVFGPRQDPRSAYTGVMALFIPQMLQDQPPTIFGDGSATRDFTFVKNNVHANGLAMTEPAAAGEVLNIACGRSIRVIEIVEAINRILGKNLQPRFAPARPGDIQHSCSSIAKAQRVLHYQPLVDFEEGLRETIAWYRRELGL